MYGSPPNPRDLFIIAIKHGDDEGMRKYAKAFLSSIYVCKPEPRIPDDKEIEFWKARTEVRIEERNLRW